MHCNLPACLWIFKTKFRVSKSGPNVILFTPLRERERERERVRCEERIDREMNWQQKLEQMKRIIVKYHPFYVHRKQGDGEKKKKKTRDRRVEKISRRLLLISKRKLARSNPNQTKDDVKGNGRLEKDE